MSAVQWIEAAQSGGQTLAHGLLPEVGVLVDPVETPASPPNSAPLRWAEAEFAERHSLYPALRKTGIRVMGGMPWGAHLCVFFETKEDLLDTAATYFSAGLESNELCACAISVPITEEDAKKVLRREIPDFDQHLAHGHIEILQGTEWYLKGDQFDLKRIRRLEREARRRVGQGLRGDEG